MLTFVVCVERNGRGLSGAYKRRELSAFTVTTLHQTMTTPLFALANTLINGVLTLESVYAKNGSSFPSLDEPFVPNALDNDAVLAATTRLIVGAAAQIIATVRPPVETLQDYALSMYTPATLGLAVDCNFADVLESVGPKVHQSPVLLLFPAPDHSRTRQGLHSRDIAQKVGLDEEKTGNTFPRLYTSLPLGSYSLTYSHTQLMSSAISPLDMSSGKLPPTSSPAIVCLRYYAKAPRSRASRRSA